MRNSNQNYGKINLKMVKGDVFETYFYKNDILILYHY